jgi:Ras-related protein Rab-1A
MSGDNALIAAWLSQAPAASSLTTEAIAAAAETLQGEGFSTVGNLREFGVTEDDLRSFGVKAFVARKIMHALDPEGSEHHHRGRRPPGKEGGRREGHLDVEGSSKRLTRSRSPARSRSPRPASRSPSEPRAEPRAEPSPAARPALQQTLSSVQQEAQTDADEAERQRQFRAACQDPAAPHDWLFKFVLVGELGVGKSSLLFRYCDFSYTDGPQATKGLDFKIRNTKFKSLSDGDTKAIKVQVWDTAGQESYRSISAFQNDPNPPRVAPQTPLPPCADTTILSFLFPPNPLFSSASSFYRGAHGVMVCFDISNRRSFMCVRRWCDEIKMVGPKSLSLVLVGTKLDLSAARVVPAADAEALALEMGIPFVETSAKDDRGVTEAFDMLVSLVGAGLVRRLAAPKDESDRPDLRKSQDKGPRGGCCA